MLLYTVDEAVIGVSAFVAAGQSLESRVFCQLERKTIAMSHFLELCNDAIRNARNRFCKQTLHQRLEHVHFVLYAEVYEVGIDENVIRRTELGVMLEEEAHFLLLHLPDIHLVNLRDYFLAVIGFVLASFYVFASYID